jgi:zinc D-Ala-D-Ala dipeptidase
MRKTTIGVIAALLVAGCGSTDSTPVSASPGADASADAIEETTAPDAGQPDLGDGEGAADEADSPSQSALLPELSTEAQTAIALALHLVAVVPPAWSDPAAKIAVFRQDVGSWTLLKGPFDAQVGSKGLSWGRGLTSPPAGATRVKVEGDKTAPAGLFRLGGLMGYDPQPPVGLHLPYQQATDNIICVDDPNSAHYNHIVDTSTVSKDWNSFEQMKRSDNLYSLLALIDHNGLSGDPAPVKSGGSCIFMHLWSGPGSPTIGCTALDGGNLVLVLAELQALDKTVLVQLPAAEYADAVAYWHLPEM